MTEDPRHAHTHTIHVCMHTCTHVHTQNKILVVVILGGKVHGDRPNLHTVYYNGKTWHPECETACLIKSDSRKQGHISIGGVTLFICLFVQAYTHTHTWAYEYTCVYECVCYVHMSM